jgi:predicted O-methyltransferase YrrM
MTLEELKTLVRTYMRMVNTVELSGPADLMRWCQAHGKVEYMVEVGVFAGQSTQVFGQFVPHILAVDAYRFDYPDNYLDHLKACVRNAGLPEGVKVSLASLAKDIFLEVAAKLPDCRLFLGTSQDAATKIKGAWDLVYIDANHAYDAVKQDLQLWLPRVRPGGFIAGHDYSESFPDLCRAVQEFFGRAPDATFADSSWVCMIPAAS